MKRVFAFTSLCVVLIALAACSSTSSSQASSVAEGEPASSVAVEPSTPQETAPIPASVADSSSSVALDPSSIISSIELLEVEGGIAYYDAYFIDGFDWVTANYILQTDIAAYAVEQCKLMLEASENSSASLMAYDKDGNISFSWDGGGTIRMYINGEYQDDYNI